QILDQLDEILGMLVRYQATDEDEVGRLLLFRNRVDKLQIGTAVHQPQPLFLEPILPDERLTNALRERDDRPVWQPVEETFYPGGKPALFEPLLCPAGRDVIDCRDHRGPLETTDQKRLQQRAERLRIYQFIPVEQEVPIQSNLVA